MKSRSSNKVQRLTTLAIFSAIVVVVQLFFGSFTVNGISFSVVLIPIVVGGAILGPSAGTILGFLFGLITLINGLCYRDPFTAFLLYNTGTKGTVVTVLVCLLKATLAGLVSALIYKALEKKNQYIAVILASAAAPIVNTGIFLLIMILVLSNELAQVMTNFGITGVSVVNYAIFGLSGINFIVEFLVNVVLSPAIYTLIKSISKGKLKA